MFRPIRYMQENLTYKIQLHVFFVVSAFSATLGRYCCPPPEAGESRVVSRSDVIVANRRPRMKRLLFGVPWHP